MSGAQAAGFRVEQDAGGGVRLHGVIDEHADLSFFGRLKGRVRVNLRNLRRINSYGVRSWIDAVRAVPAGTVLEFTECPPPAIDQLNMVAGFLGNGRLISFYAPMACERCQVEEDRLFQLEDCQRAGGKLIETHCPRCGKPMELDDVESHYLGFLREE